MAWESKANLKGEPGYNATGAAEDDIAIASFIRETAGPTETAEALNATYARGVSVTAHGAVGDGVANDTAAFTAAIAAADDVVYVPGGNYKLDPLTLKSNVILKGAGREVATLTFTSTGDRVINLAGLSNVVVEDLRVVWTTALLSHYTHGAFFLDNSKNIMVRRCDIETTERSAINLRKPADPAAHTLVNKNVTFDSCKVTVTGGAYSYGVYCPNRTALTQAGNQWIKIENCEFIGGVSGILIDGDNCRILRNHVHDRVGSGIGTYFVSDLIIEGNVSENNTVQGIAIGNGTDDLAENVTVRGNICRNNGYQGIVSYKQGGDGYNPAVHVNTGLNKGILIESNYCYGNDVNGIFSYVNNRAIITKNHCYDNLGLGIQISSDNNVSKGEMIVTDNKCHNNGGQGIGMGGATVLREATIKGNQCKANGSYGFDLNFLTEFTFTENIAVDNQFSGVRVRGASDAGIIAYNIAKRNNVVAGAHQDFELGGTNMFVLFNIGVTSNLSLGGYTPAAAMGNSWSPMFRPGNTADYQGNGFNIGGYGNLTIGYKKHSYGSATPTTGTWSQGDRVYNTAPAAGGYEGWICVASGTPGTWKGFGLIAA